MMGVGKSTLGKTVAKKLNLEFVDTDLNIEKKYSMKIWKIFENKGEKFFRLEEEKEVLECLKKNKTVIALGGGAFMNKNIRNLILKNSLSFWLDLNLKIINKRIKWNNKRPLLEQEDSKEIIKMILILAVFFIGIFLLDKIDFPTPTKFIKQEISNDKLITLK